MLCTYINLEPHTNESIRPDDSVEAWQDTYFFFHCTRHSLASTEMSESLVDWTKRHPAVYYSTTETRVIRKVI
jgi:hypothetical protein